MAEAKVRFTADTRGLRNGVSNASRLVGGLRTAVLGVGTAFAALGIARGISAVGRFGIETAKSASKAAMAFEQTKIQFQVLIGDVERANKLVRQLQTFGATTPLQQEDIFQATTTLLAFGIGVEDVLPSLKKLGDISRGNGARLQSLARAFGKMSSAGRASMEDINIMIDAAFNPLAVIAEKTGEEMVMLRERVSDGKVSFQEISDAMTAATSEGGDFYEMLVLMSETTAGKLSNLQDAWTQLQIAFGTGLNVGVGKTAEEFTKVIENIKGIVTRLGEDLGDIISKMAEKIPGLAKTFEEGFKIGEKTSFFEGMRQGLVNVAKDPTVKSAFTAMIKGIIDAIPGMFGDLASGVLSPRENAEAEAQRKVGVNMITGGLLTQFLVRGGTAGKIASTFGKTAIAGGLVTTMTAQDEKATGTQNLITGISAGLIGKTLFDLASPGGSIVKQAQKAIKLERTIAALKAGVSPTVLAGAGGGTAIGIGLAALPALIFGYYKIKIDKEYMEKRAERRKLLFGEGGQFDKKLKEKDTTGWLSKTEEERQKELELSRKKNAVMAEDTARQKSRVNQEKALQDEATRRAKEFGSWSAAYTKLRKDAANKELKVYEMEHVKAVAAAARKPGGMSLRPGALMFPKGLTPDTMNFKEYFRDIKEKNRKKEPISIPGFGLGRLSGMITSLAALGGGKAFAGSNNLVALQTAANGYLARIEQNTKNINGSGGSGGSGTMVPVWG